MTFKDVIADDIATFLNDLEFADTHTINKTSCIAVVQDVVINDSLYPNYGKDSYREGVYAYGSVINVRKSDLPKVPAMGTVLVLDGKRGQVINVADDEGILTITWVANEL